MIFDLDANNPIDQAFQGVFFQLQQQFQRQLNLQ